MRILSEKLSRETSVGTPLTVPKACFDGAGNESVPTPVLAMVKHPGWPVRKCDCRL